MARDLAFLLGCIALLAGTRYGMSAQVADSKIAALDSLSAAERHARLVEGARAEGGAVIYLNLDPGVANALTGGFMKKYPGVNAQIGRFSGAAIIARVEAEARAGKL